MSRTNKQGIASKKRQQQKQAVAKGGSRFMYPKRNIDLETAKAESIIGVVQNPKGNSYHWFLKGRRVCWETRLNIDPDGYRFIKLPNGWTNIVEIFPSGYIRKKLQKLR